MAAVAKHEHEGKETVPVPLGRPISISDVVKPLLVKLRRGATLVSSVHFPGRVTVSVGSIVEVLSPSNQRKHNFYLYVCSVSGEGQAGLVQGYSLYTETDIRKALKCKSFASNELFLTHEAFSVTLCNVVGAVRVLPGLFAPSVMSPHTGPFKLFSFFFDHITKELRPIKWQASSPPRILEFMASSCVVACGGAERNMTLFRKHFFRGLQCYSEKWRTKMTNPKKGVKVALDGVDLEQILCLPFRLLESATIDTSAANLVVSLHNEDDLSEILGGSWLKLQVKARKVEAGEVLSFLFELPAKVSFNWKNEETMCVFHGLSMRNGCGVLQWSTTAGNEDRLKGVEVIHRLPDIGFGSNMLQTRGVGQN